ncbi:FAD-binding oxidoreductase [Sporichthya brevicatena]|uniref:nitric oxide dioxygenase n=1 Tax=Sporichthya brevicatena TaxID=171442 RepID=A0ABN1GAM2_9ACTN
MTEDLIKNSFAVVEPQADRVASYFYARLFMEAPELRELFPVAMDLQRDRLFGALVRIVQGSDQPEFLDGFLTGLGRDHRKFGVKAAHYEALGRSLLAAIARYAGDAWTPEVQNAWVEAYARVARTMIEAARRAALDTPDWWLAEIVEHEERAADIAVVRLRPDQPFPYEAGQYCSVETPWWPRVWRNYSMATAPNKDNLLEFHVRKVDAGWVSTALVRKARPGDVVRIGHATGTMTADRTSDRDLVCIAGGTGLAPMKAIIEDMGRWNWYRRVHLFVGARTVEDLYDLAAINSLARAYEWLNVVPAISDQPDFPGEQGVAVDVALRHGDWRNHDVFISGSAPMVRNSIDRLLISGVSLSRIRFDSFG